MRHMLSARLRGQSLPIVVLMLALILMVVGLGIDGGLFYAQRRLMQNTADSACLAAANQLAMGKPSTDAQAAAITVIENNLGPAGPGTGANAPGTLTYAAVADLYSPAVGAEASLTRGIELNGPQVRVAVSSPAFTYFVRLLGQDEYTVAARARCDATAGGGGTPFAVARWRRYDGNRLVTGISTDLSIASQLTSGSNGNGNGGNGNGGGNTPVVRDVLDAAPHTITEWPDWGTSNFPGSPSSGTGLFSQPNVPATLDNPGFETVLAGQGATPNIGGTSFSGPVLLDLRNITFPNPEYYSGLTPDTSTNVYKDFVTRDILEGYSGPWIPPGTQIGFTDGVSAGQVEQPFDLRYNENDIVSTLVYNGTVYFKTDFGASIPASYDALQARSTAASFSGMFPENCDLSGLEEAYIFEGSNIGFGHSELNALEYGLTVTPFETRGNNRLPHAINVDVRAFSSVNGDSWNNLQARWSDGSENSGWISFRGDGTASSTTDFGLDSYGETLTVKLQQARTDFCEYFDPNAPPPYPAPLDPEEPQTPDEIYEMPIKPVSGAASIYLEATDTQTGLRRGHYVFMNLAAEDDDFFAYMPGQIAYAPVELDDNRTQTLEQPMVIQRVDGQSLAADDVGVSFAWFTGALQPTGAPTGISAALNQRNGAPVLDIGVAPNATPGRDYYLRIAVNYGGHTHWAWYYIAVQPQLGNSRNISEYVYTLGYANFLITDITANQIKGRAISGLLKPGDVITGRQPRLIPWNE
jgi:hypothetical protein